MEERRRQQVLRQLHWIGRVEGTSLLILLGIAMPLKYLAGNPQAVLIVGSIHGALWIIYLLALLRAWISVKWPLSTAILGGVASVLPFGPWWFERWSQRQS